jgi:hypothetical protein
MSIAAQSLLSVPPAPELILRIAPSWSSSFCNIFLTSRSSISDKQFLYWLSTSSSVVSPSLKKSLMTLISSIAELILSNDVVQLLS